MQVRRGNADDGESDADAFVACLLPGVDDLTTTAPFERETIAVQCCRTDGTCVRKTSDDDDTCLSGFSDKDGSPPYITEHTFGEAVSICAANGLELCAGSCAGTGCSYNRHPVFSSLPCPSPPPPRSPPLPPPPSQPPAPPPAQPPAHPPQPPSQPPSLPPAPPPGIPPSGMQVRRGNADDGESDADAFVACLLPGVDDLTTTAPFERETIAVQCCRTDGTCVRKTSDDDDTCLSGFSDKDGSPPYITEHTFGEAVSICAANGLELCAGSCAGTGCSYNRHPVFSSLPCPSPPPPRTPPPPYRPPSQPLSDIPAPGIQIIQGDNSGAFVACLRPSGANVTAAPWGKETIALQCCKTNSGECVRRLDNDNSKCLAGMSGEQAPYITQHTYGQAAKACASMEMELCTKSCAGTGCSYNRHPVYTRLLCETTSVGT